MGTRGYKVYRWRRWYFAYYTPWDSYPSNVGVKFLETVPNDAQAFQAWLANKRQELDEMIEKFEKGEVDEKEVTITRNQPRNDPLIEWIYEIDLDRLVFHVDSYPLFRLDHLPSPDLFLEYIGFDHYGRRACEPSTPVEYRYNWDAPPPVVADAALELYNCHDVNSAEISDLLLAPTLMTDREMARVRILQVVIGNLMRSDQFGLLVRELTQVADHSKFSMVERSLAWYLLDIAIGPQIFRELTSENLGKPEDYDLDLIRTRRGRMPSFSQFLGSDFPEPGIPLQCSKTPWRRQNICVHLVTHLDYQRNMQAAIAGLVADAMENLDNLGGIIYGVAFSVFHCVIVRIDTQSGFTVTHSDVLQFLPSFYAYSSSTPGITALARLGYYFDNEISEVACTLVQLSLPYVAHPLQLIKARMGRIWGLANGRSKSLCGNHIFPVEVWERIALQLYDSDDLLLLAQVSPESRSAVENILRYPLIGEYRVIQALDCPDDEDSKGKDEVSNPLWSASFKVISATGQGYMILQGQKSKCSAVLPQLPWDSKNVWDRTIRYSVSY